MKHRTRWLPLVALLLMAHDGSPPQPHDVWESWNWHPVVVFGLFLPLAVYSRGLLHLWQRRGVGQVVSVWHAAAFLGGILGLFVALVSPLDALSEALFSAHMIQHILIIFVASPLIIVSRPLPTLLRGLPNALRRFVHRIEQKMRVNSGWKFLTHPLVVWIIHTSAWWLWHLPVLYEAALTSEPIHVMEHSSFLGTSLLYWWYIFQAVDAQAGHYGVRILSLFTMSLQGGLLGALITFSRTPWYRIYSASVESWGISLLEDQQLAGILMWIPAGFVYLIVILFVMMRWLNAIEPRSASLGPSHSETS